MNVNGDNTNLLSCRACLVSSNNNYPLFENIPGLDMNIAKMLADCSLVVEDIEGLPNTVCAACFETLQSAYNFLQSFKKSQELLLRQYVSDHKEKIIIIKEDGSIDENFVLQIDELSNSFDKEGSESESLHESDEQDILIAQSVRLTQLYRLHKSSDDENFTESDNDTKEENQEDIQSLRVKSVNVQKLPCPACSKIFKRLALFGQHLNRHQGPFVCTFCDINCNDASTYLKHYQLKHLFQCKVCQESFLTNATYKTHMQSHDAPKFVCPIESCSKTFAVKQSLRNHYKTIHTDMHNFLCNFCGLAFKNYDNLRYHMKKHKGPPHLCTYCGRRFMQAVHLTYHMWRHTGVKPHKCANCDKSFVSKKVLMTHMMRNNCGGRRRQTDI